MSDFGTMQDRVAGELKRPDLDAEIKASILSAIAYYKRKRFDFNTKRASLVTIPGQEYYQLPEDFIEADTLVLEADTDLDYLEQRSHHWLDREKEWGSYRSRPDTFSIQNKEMRLYPVPDKSYTVVMSFIYELGSVSASAADTATNAWMTEAEELIRTHAKVDMFESVIRGPESFQEASGLRRRLAEIYRQMDVQVKRSHSSGRIQPWQ